MPSGHYDVASADGPTAADFDGAFSAPYSPGLRRVWEVAEPGLRRVWEVAEPGLPPQIEPLSFVSPGLLRYVLRALDLAAGQVLVDLGCGRGGALTAYQSTRRGLVGPGDSGYGGRGGNLPRSI